MPGGCWRIANKRSRATVFFRKDIAMPQSATFVFHGALNDFLGKYQKDKPVLYSFTGAPAVKDAIEAIGVPHPEVGAITMHGKSITFSDRLLPDSHLQVYPSALA